MKKRYSFGKKLTVCMLVLLLVMQKGIFAVYMLRPDNAALAYSESSNLADFVDHIEVFDSGGSPANGIFAIGDTYTFCIYFAETSPDLQLGYDGGGYLTFQLPPEILIVSPVSNEPILLAKGDTGGYYSITTGGLVTVSFLPVDNDGNDISPINFIDKYFNVSFMLKIDAELKADTTVGGIPFGDKNIYVSQVLTSPPKMNVTKSSEYVSLNQTNETVNYTITIEAPAGNSSASPKNLTNIVLADIPTISATSGIATDDVITSIVCKNGSTTLDPEITWTGGKLNLDFEDYELPPGQTITVTYTLDINKLIEEYNDRNSSKLSNLQYNFDVANAVSVSADSAMSVSKSATRTVSRSFLSKTNNVGSTTNPSSITWTATVGTNKKDKLNGNTITDTLTVSTSQAVTMPTPAQVTVKLYDTSGSLISTITDGTGVTVSGKTITYDVPSGGTDVYKAELIYTVGNTNLTAIGSVTYTNTLSYKGVTKVDTVTSTLAEAVVTIPGPTGFTKTSAHVKYSDTGWKAADGTDHNFYVDYTVNFTIPGDLGNRDRPIFLRDVIDTASAGGRVDVDLSSITVTSGGSDMPYWARTNTAGDTLYICFSNPDSALLDWGYAVSKTVTVTYRLWLTEAIAHGIKSGKSLLNTATIRTGTSYTGGTDLATTTATDYWPVRKSGTVSADSDFVFDFVVTIESNETQTEYNTGAPKFTDKFNEGPGTKYLEYVPNSFKVYDKTSSISYPVTDANLDLTDPDAIKVADFRTIISTANYVQGHIIEVHYQLRIKSALETDAYNNAPLAFTNTAAIWENSFNAEFASTAAVTYNPRPHVSKTMDPTGSGSATFDVEIIINPNHLDLNPGKPTITAYDVMSANLSFYRSTLKVDSWNGSTWVKVADNDWKVEVKGKTNELIFELPNNIPIKITYSVFNVTPKGQAKDVTNYISVYGYSDTAAKNAYVVNQTNAFAGGSSLDVYITKRDKSNDGLLNDAKFELYVSSTSGDLIYGNKKFSKVTEAVRDTDDGVYMFKNPRIGAFASDIYLIIETQIPKGHVVLTPPDNYTFFVLGLESAWIGMTEAVAISDNLEIYNMPFVPSTPTPTPDISYPPGGPPPSPTTESLSPSPTPDDETPAPTTTPDETTTTPDTTPDVTPDFTPETPYITPFDETIPTPEPQSYTVPDYDTPEYQELVESFTNGIPPVEPGHRVEYIDDEHFFEFDGDVPLGEWHYDPDLDEWIFDEFIPLGALPQTGNKLPSIAWTLLLLAGSLILFGLHVRIRVSQRNG
ncbi:MAG: hypothetical protein FWG36_04925 [Oscillospiraceae bacterium]|nr:hypothetical protein [Oscillospiraceae bacterium]